MTLSDDERTELINKYSEYKLNFYSEFKGNYVVNFEGFEHYGTLIYNSNQDKLYQAIGTPTFIDENRFISLGKHKHLISDFILTYVDMKNDKTFHYSVGVDEWKNLTFLEHDRIYIELIEHIHDMKRDYNKISNEIKSCKRNLLINIH